MTTRKHYHALLRQDLYSFIAKAFGTVMPGSRFMPNWHIRAIAWHLELIERGEINRLIITLPPRHLKSISASVAFPAWLLGRDPTRHIVCVSYSQSLAGKHAADMRRVMYSDWYRDIFPQTRFDPRQSPLIDLTTTKGGYRMSTSVGGSLTGRGGDILIIDDPHKADEVGSDVTRVAVIDWYRNTLLSRLNHPDDPIIVIQQRLHEDDLAGHLLETGDWVHLNLPAIAIEDEWIELGEDEDDWHYRHEGDLLHPERVSAAALEELKAQLGPYPFDAQYQQSPAPFGGGLINWEWFQFYDRIPRRYADDLIVQSWDPAQSVTEHADYSVCTTWLVQKDRFYLLDMIRFRAEYPELLQRVLVEAERWRPNEIIIEAVAHGKALVDDVRKKTRFWIRASIPRTDKVSRMVGESAALAGKYVYLPKDAPWLNDFRREMVAFPMGKHDDVVDSLSQFLYWTRVRGPRRFKTELRVTVAQAMPDYRTEDILNCPWQ